MSPFPVPQLLIPLAFAGFAAYRGYLRLQGREDRENALETWAALNGYDLVPEPDGSTPTTVESARASRCRWGYREGRCSRSHTRSEVDATR